MSSSEDSFPSESHPSESNSSESNSSESNPSKLHPSEPNQQSGNLERLEQELAEAEASLDYRPSPEVQPQGAAAAYVKTATPPLVMVETAFLASTASLLWLVSYYLSIGPWMRILFPTPIALVYLRWGHRAAWMAAVTCGLLLSVLMGPYLSLLFFIPYAVMGVQLGAMWKRRSPWFASIGLGTLISTFGFFMRVGLLSIFLGEDLWSYLTNRITDLIQLVMGRLVNWGLLGLDALTPPSLPAVQLATLGVVLCSDLVYLFTVHLAAWLLLERLGNPIPNPPRWVQVILDEER